MAQLALDTNAMSAILGGDQAAIKLVDSFEGVIILPMIVYGELLYGFRGGNRYDQNMRELQKLLQALNIDVITINEDICQAYARIFIDLKKQGTPIPVNDIWIAATCSAMGYILMTHDTDFNNIKELQSLRWD